MRRPIALIPVKRPARRAPRAPAAAAPPAPPALVLVEAQITGSDESPNLQLGFDRAVDAGAFDGSQVVVDIGVLGLVYDGTGGVTVLGPTTLQIGLVSDHASAQEDTTLTASAATGIVAADGGTWAGCDALVLPFPA